ncbi:sulfurtransferase [Paenibacillaceae bacterium]|nr:sulfurtransferase [Paenibacillaceae bacterium]
MTDTQTSNYPNGHLLVDTAWVDNHRHDANIVLLDARAKGYDEGHIPGAGWLDVKALKNSELYAIAAADALETLLASHGVTNDTTIVIYDEGGGVLAARAFYVLEYYGLKDRVKLLNGGYAAWIAAGKEIGLDRPLPPVKGNLTLVANNQLIVSRTDIQAGLANSVILDARSAQEYTGEDQRSNRIGGHIEGAVHKEWKDALSAADEHGVIFFKDHSVLKREFAEAGIEADKTIVPYCQTNQRGAHSYFILRLLGYEDIRPYEGSWDEWGNT